MLSTLSSEELVFIKAIDRYKVEKNKNFLSWTEVLGILKDLGYRQIAQPAPPASESANPSKKTR